MPTYTMELWRVIDLKPNSIGSVAEWLGLDKYPIFDSSYREKLNTKIMNHFMFQEIGHETIEQFRFRMRAKMDEIMPLYNQLYKNALIEFDPLVTVDILNTSTGEQEQQTAASQSNETESDVDSAARNVVSNFPQVMLNANKDYASNGADSNSQSKTKATIADESTGSSNMLSETESRTKGYQGAPAQLIRAARDLIINTDMLVIAEVEPLFMMVWNNSDEYTATKGRYYL